MSIDFVALLGQSQRYGEWLAKRAAQIEEALGDRLRITGAGGWNEKDGELFVLQKVESNENRPPASVRVVTAERRMSDPGMFEQTWEMWCHAVDAIAVVDQVAGLLAPGRGLDHLAPDPGRSRMRGHVEVEQVAAIMADQEEDVQGLEAQGLDHE